MIDERRLMQRSKELLDDGRHPCTNCWCERQSDVYPKAPGSSHTTHCLDIQKLYTDIEEALRETATV